MSAILSFVDVFADFHFEFVLKTPELFAFKISQQFSQNLPRFARF